MVRGFCHGAGAAALLALPAAAHAVEARMGCTFTGVDFVYDCRIVLRERGKPLAGVQASLTADMPSMPGMHAVAPVRLRAGKAPGEYLARLDLDMTGEWEVKLHLGGAAPEVVVLRYAFDEKGARPVTRSSTAPRR